jgi:hypothetical protein
MNLTRQSNTGLRSGVPRCAGKLVGSWQLGKAPALPKLAGRKNRGHARHTDVGLNAASQCQPLRRAFLGEKAAHQHMTRP